MKETNIDFKLEYDKEIIQKIRKKKKMADAYFWHPVLVLLRFHSLILDIFTHRATLEHHHLCC